MSSIIRKVISTTKAPAAIGAYSQAVLVDRTVYISGQIGMDPSTGQLVPGGVVEEAKQALKNLGEILKAAGCDFTNDFQGNLPARAAYQVAALPKGSRIEIEAIAVQGPFSTA
ncbi:2-iminobutanoate/2-iminopropanoate deaminase isoform X2 [Meriones unguiculatus]|uniref:2-iminobutanoate/2-iminopropanoate deaminase isoform X2 n=1 Tax=Meriones unguiculatus TaxID=10047 RepID=UPI000B4F200D|nr:2-iminobutanoate/2-iminopropanoate deaminase isoform X2 [Meriones unguiculatus]